MAAFVTGGSGFLGQHLIRTLRAQGVEVRALARSASAVEKVKRAGAQPIPGDLDDLKALQSGMEGCTVVYHAAAKYATGEIRRIFRELMWEEQSKSLPLLVR